MSTSAAAVKNTITNMSITMSTSVAAAMNTTTSMDLSLIHI